MVCCRTTEQKCCNCAEINTKQLLFYKLQYKIVKCLQPVRVLPVLLPTAMSQLIQRKLKIKWNGCKSVNRSKVLSLYTSHMVSSYHRESKHSVEKCRKRVSDKRASRYNSTSQKTKQCSAKMKSRVKIEQHRRKQFSLAAS